MAKTMVIPWNTLNPQTAFHTEDPVMAVSQSLGIPQVPQGGSGGTNISMATDIWPEVLQVADWCALGILVLSGGMWMFGNRTPALQKLIDMVIGYEIIRHGLRLLSWLRSF